MDTKRNTALEQGGKNQFKYTANGVKLFVTLLKSYTHTQHTHRKYIRKHKRDVFEGRGGKMQYKIG